MAQQTRVFESVDGPGILVLEELATLSRRGQTAEIVARVSARDTTGNIVEVRYHDLFIRSDDRIVVRNLEAPVSTVLDFGGILDGAVLISDFGDDVVRLVVCPGKWEPGDHTVNVTYEVDVRLAG